MKIYDDTKVYVFCPAKVASGGPELLHQLASKLRAMNIESYMDYVYYAGDEEQEPVHENYRKYHLPYVVNTFIDNPHNIVIYPEVFTEYLSRQRKVRQIVWWLSVDNYVKHVAGYYGEFIRQEAYLYYPVQDFGLWKSDKSVEHWVQSEYARRFLHVNGIDKEKIHYVSDYLSWIFSNADMGNASKKNQVVFNPKKGWEFTQKIIERAPDITWLPIIDMPPAKVRDVLSESKVYIDFGNHPGKDRIPREAAMAGCCIITGKKGAAANEIDIPIPQEYKFNDEEEQIPAIIAKIRNIFTDYEIHNRRFLDYREKICEEHERFSRDVEQALEFEDKKNTPKRTALCMAPQMAQIVWQYLQENANADYRGICVINDEFCGNCIDNGKEKIPIITKEDASFLYKEKRIEKIMLKEGNETEQAEFLNWPCLRNDLLLVSLDC